MLALEVEYLLGRVVASRHDDRRRVEWPPHPSRLFSALVAAFHESDLEDSGHPFNSAAERALRWIENGFAPDIYADPPALQNGGRDSLIRFVPVNDSNEQMNTSAGKRYPTIGLDIQLRRLRAERWFPAFTPNDPIVRFVWPKAEPTDELTAGLTALADRVTYLGHSMSPVRVAVSKTAPKTTPKTTLCSDPSGDMHLRTVGAGRLDHLREVHTRRMKNSSIQPRLGRMTPYAVLQKDGRLREKTLFRRWLVYRRIEGPRLPMESTSFLTAQVRRAVMQRYPNPLPEWISGHEPDGTKSKRAHLAIIPLPDVAHSHADGHLMGFALLGPNNISETEWASMEDALYGFDTLVLGAAGTWRIAPVSQLGQLPKALRMTTWMRESDTWASVTPVVFGHYPDRSREKSVVLGQESKKIRVVEVSIHRRIRIVTDMCAQVGLNAVPIELRLGTLGVLPGCPKAGAFAQSKMAVGKFTSHAWIRFDRRIQGPVVLGTGRFGGLGLLKPLT